MDTINASNVSKYSSKVEAACGYVLSHGCFDSWGTLTVLIIDLRI